jgi:hypothetical protein
MLEVLLHRARRDPQDRGDLGIRLAFCYELDDLTLTWSEVGVDAAVRLAVSLAKRASIGASGGMTGSCTPPL